MDQCKSPSWCVEWVGCGGEGVVYVLLQGCCCCKDVVMDMVDVLHTTDVSVVNVLAVSHMNTHIVHLHTSKHTHTHTVPHH